MKKVNINKSVSGSLTRRDFVRTSATAAALGVVTIPALANVRSGGRSDTLKIGLIGCGGRGTGAAAQALAADPDVVLHAMGDAFDDQLQSSLKRLKKSSNVNRIDVPEARQFSGFDAYKQVIDSGVDVVLLATTPVFRPIHLEYAISKDKHVFCEKPVAIDAPGIRKVLELAEEAERRDLRLMSGFCWRYSLPQLATYKKIHDGAIGEIRAMETTYQAGPLTDVPRQAGWSDMEWQLRNWKAFTWLSGDHIVEQAIHAIDWISWAMQGEMPVRVSGNGGRQCRSGEWTGNMYDHFSMCYEFADGQRAFHLCRQIANTPFNNNAYFMGTEGYCRSNPWTPECVIENNGHEIWRYEGDNNDMYQTEHNELFAAIRSGRKLNEGVAMAHSTMMGIMGRMCAYSGQSLTWDQCINSTESFAPAEWAWGDVPFPSVAKPGITPFV
ncbi:MAG: Gfo/Idh/MocA family oxidoreductase [Planctomycetota bacterium]|nr:Gfo/Idh/MocA family oxidoreductase [Planctomycetota bacterium]